MAGNPIDEIQTCGPVNGWWSEFKGGADALRNAGPVQRQAMQHSFYSGVILLLMGMKSVKTNHGLDELLAQIETETQIFLGIMHQRIQMLKKAPQHEPDTAPAPVTRVGGIQVELKDPEHNLTSLLEYGAGHFRRQHNDAVGDETQKLRRMYYGGVLTAINAINAVIDDVRGQNPHVQHVQINLNSLMSELGMTAERIIHETDPAPAEGDNNE